MSKFCFWSVADGDHADMMKTCIESARNVGVTEDFHIWTDKDIPGAICHECGKYDKYKYLFKLRFLYNEVKKLDYQFFIFLDADNYFVRKPEDDAFDKLLNGNKIFVQMENECTSSKVKRDQWWGMSLKFFIQTNKIKGVQNNKIWNTNAGFWIVKKDYIDEFYEKTMDFWLYCFHDLGIEFTEEAPIAYIGNLQQKNPEQSSLRNTSHIWASDWTGNYKDRIPTGEEWDFEDYLSGEKVKVNPCIVHAMRSKKKMIALAKNEELYPNGFWHGHQMLGDVIGFCGAAHLYYLKTGERVKVWFQESRKDILKYFDGVDWVPRNSIPNAVDCGATPSSEEWKVLNGVKRFYKWMDPTMISPKPFDIYFNKQRKIPNKKIIGLITHSNTQGDIDEITLKLMISDAISEYPEHKIVLIGNMDNTIIPEGIEDMRQSEGDISWIVDTVAELDLLITPQSGPCFCAAGWNVPMWVYRSKEEYWDYTLNYDTYRVRKWYSRNLSKIEQKLELVSVKGHDYYIRPNTWDHTILYHINDYSVSKYITYPQNACIVDIGGHIGGFTKILANKYPTVPIYTFEPDKENFKILSDNVKELKNVKIFNMGVGAANNIGSMEISFPGNTGMNRFVVGSGDACVLSPDDFFNIIKEKNIALMKIDCEGGEWGFFDKLSDSQKNRIWEIQGELHTDLFNRYEPFKDYPQYDENFTRKLLKQKFEKFNIFIDSCKFLKAYNKEHFL